VVADQAEPEGVVTTQFVSEYLAAEFRILGPQPGDMIASLCNELVVDDLPTSDITVSLEGVTN
jgi:hypothetical protein